MIKTIDGYDIPFIHEEVDEQHVVLFCHGITSSKEEGGFYNDFSDRLCHDSFSTFRFDFRGHGESAIPSSKAMIAGMIADFNTVYSYIEEKYSMISVVAASFGASILLLLLQQRKLQLRCAVLLNPVTDFSNTFTSTISIWSQSFFPSGGLGKVLAEKQIKIGESFILNPLMTLELFYYDPKAVGWMQTAPAIIFHGTRDQIVSIRTQGYLLSIRIPRIFDCLNLKSSHGLEENRAEVIEESSKFIRNPNFYMS